MTKLFTTLLVLSLATLTGCQLYFGDDGDSDDRWTYCANDGYYVCDGDNCEWAGARCPDDPSYVCETNEDCAAGCYCSTDGVCEEAGFCDGGEGQCPAGFHCEVDRASCVPDTCTTSADCDAGEYCDETVGCTTSCACTTDAEAQAQGFGFCDEARGTCEPTPAGGSCGGTSTCATAEPTCPVGEVALISEGCYTGACATITTCDVTPACGALQHEADCLGANASCSSVYTGINCTKPDGSACMAGDTGCTCQTFQFNSCTDRTSAMKVLELANGTFVDLLAQ